MGAQKPLIVLFNQQQHFLLEWDGKPGVWMGGGQLGALSCSLEAVTLPCLLVQSSWFPEVPLSSVWSPWEPGWNKPGEGVGFIPCSGGQRPSGSCLPCVSVGFCGRKLLLG